MQSHKHEGPSEQHLQESDQQSRATSWGHARTCYQAQPSRTAIRHTSCGHTVDAWPKALSRERAADSLAGMAAATGGEQGPAPWKRRAQARGCHDPHLPQLPREPSSPRNGA